MDRLCSSDPPLQVALVNGVIPAADVIGPPMAGFLADKIGNFRWLEANNCLPAPSVTQGVHVSHDGRQWRLQPPLALHTRQVRGRTEQRGRGGVPGGDLLRGRVLPGGPEDLRPAASSQQPDYGPLCGGRWECRQLQSSKSPPLSSYIIFSYIN